MGIVWEYFMNVDYNNFTKYVSKKYYVFFIICTNMADYIQHCCHKMSVIFVSIIAHSMFLMLSFVTDRQYFLWQSMSETSVHQTTGMLVTYLLYIVYRCCWLCAALWFSLTLLQVPDFSLTKPCQLLLHCPLKEFYSHSIHFHFRISIVIEYTL